MFYFFLFVGFETSPRCSNLRFVMIADMSVLTGDTQPNPEQVREKELTAAERQLCRWKYWAPHDRLGEHQFGRRERE